ncbi:type I DNA topoisomerase [Neomoorella thermoacetica]|uniref:DNA topoisomerase 1 n=2 Tax=Neomoorella thermoacetica TaxID=1525 RepID=A0AAC9HGZ0_NEOTH|nr:type I DNA topoisomerase [Moorella thermoacetica]AKX93787.1 DNA topoisomerase 1 [Moorella thermoacetica]AKX96429.1 DNA topoisomerase 1 [Moorella thermoacetica]AOQ23706.1 DNA topoisomerase 1 [Moorella thermoacetica]OIQ57599.1 DNA topoisomerase 1 [Moorella thermoacetica]QDA00243.1 DNA topoisomerase 1 [Moorella thermoacetica]
MLAKTLVIVESPAKAKTIGKFLGKNYTIKPSMGHVRDLPKSQFGVDVENNFEPRYITIRGKGEIVKELRAAAQKAQRVLLAPDPDREGEAIAWHLQHLLGLPDEAIRIEFNEITRNAIQEAVKKPRKIDQDRVDAQQARRILDRVVGYRLSPLLWRKVRKGLSAGRVQSVAVRLIVDREQEIEAFQPEEYWSLTAWLLPENEGEAFPARLVKYAGEDLNVKNEGEMESILHSLEGTTYVVAEVKQRERRKNPAAPFTTSTLQQEAYRKLNFTSRRTMQVAQQLYEGIDLGGGQGPVGLITYIRTDSTRVASVAQLEARDFLMERFGSEYVPEGLRQYKGRKDIQDAHEAIRPTSVWREPASLKNILTRDQFRLYNLIWERFVASQMQAAVMDTVTVDITAGPCLFRATGSVVKFPGFLKVYQEGRDGEDKDQEQRLPPLATGQTLKLQSLEPKQHFTQPPPRYTEATLVKTMEELGIGRPSTYAPTIETILQRGYVTREQKQFVPTELGRVVVALLKEHFPKIIDVEFTAHMEEQLDAIEAGKISWRQVLAEFYGPFEEVLEKAEAEIGTVEVPEEVSEEKCELCGRNLVVKMGRYGKFLACPGFPECRFTKPLLETIGVNCPECGGQIVARRTKRGRKFYGCQNYPRCTYVSWDKPTNQTCPRCGKRLVEKASRQGSRLVCPQKECGYVEEVRQAK